MQTLFATGSFALKGVKAKVASTGSGFAVNVASDDPATVAEIQKRANALKQ
jgi:hypothetical protein